LHFARREDAVDAAVRDLLRAERSHQSQALLLSRELQEVRALAHDRRTTSRHFKDLFFLGFPRDDVELFNLNKTKQQQQQEKVVEKKGQLKFFVVFVVGVLDTHNTREKKKF
tara:strand:+ start:334 stop:669 length:336 start_codon:yes stop_codon:yes gene_type:complete